MASVRSARVSRSLATVLAFGVVPVVIEPTEVSACTWTRTWEPSAETVDATPVVWSPKGGETMATPSICEARRAKALTAAPPAAERTLRKRENTRARLIEAAADIVASKGIASTRIDDIVKQAGFTRGAFYSNYSSLQDILTEAIVMRSNTLLSRVTQAIDSFEGAPPRWTRSWSCSKPSAPRHAPSTS